MGYNFEAAPNTFLSQNISKNATIFLGAEIKSLTLWRTEVPNRFKPLTYYIHPVFPRRIHFKSFLIPKFPFLILN
jgi:hypothetical protein